MSTSGIFRRSSVQLSMFPLSISSIFWCLTSTIRLLFRSLRKLSFSSVSRPRLTAFLAISSRFRSSNFPLFYECTEFFYAHFVDSFIHRHTIRCHDENSGPHFVRYGAPSRDTFLRNNRKFDNRIRRIEDAKPFQTTYHPAVAIGSLVVEFESPIHQLNLSILRIERQITN